jgi:hypothetical protein
VTRSPTAGRPACFSYSRPGKWKSCHGTIKVCLQLQREDLAVCDGNAGNFLPMGTCTPILFLQKPASRNNPRGSKTQLEALIGPAGCTSGKPAYACDGMMAWPKSLFEAQFGAKINDSFVWGVLVRSSQRYPMRRRGSEAQHPRKMVEFFERRRHPKNSVILEHALSQPRNRAPSTAALDVVSVAFWLEPANHSESDTSLSLRDLLAANVFRWPCHWLPPWSCVFTFPDEN